MRLTSIRLAAVPLLLLGGVLTSSTYAGTLYFDFNRNLNPPNASVFLFGDAGQTATVSNLAGFSQGVTLSAEGFFNLPIPSSFQQFGIGIRDTGFKVVSNQPIAGYFINRASATTDMTYLADQGALGTQYVVASQGGGFGEGSQVAIHATQDGTSVTFTPKGGAPVNVMLNAGQTYKYAGGSTNLTGSFVSADKPVAVFAGHECAQVPVGTTACDTLLEQMIATDKLSKTYAVTASLPGQGNGDLVRVIATVDGTEVKVNGVVVATLNAGEYHEFSVTSGARIEASAAVMVAQYLKGQSSPGTLVQTDPAMSLVPGSDTWLKAYRLSTPAGAQQFLTNYASVVMPTSDLGSLLLNGLLVDTSMFAAIAGTPYSRGLVNLPIGLFTLTGANPFLVMLGGGASFDSYLTYGGATFAPGVSPPPDGGGAAPEPATLALLGLGLLGLATRRRKA